MFLLLSQASNAFTVDKISPQPISDNNSRRSFFGKVMSSSLVVALPTITNAEVIQASGTCVSGQGDVCKDLAEGNEFIKALQKCSIENQEKYRQLYYSSICHKRYGN